MQDAVSRFQAKPMDEEAARSIEDQEYHAGMVEYGRKKADLLNPIWEEKIFSGKSVFRA